MSEDLADIKRLKVTRETRAWLQAEARETGRSYQDIARDVLHEKALGEIRKAKILTSLADAEGHSGDRRGQSDN